MGNNRPDRSISVEASGDCLRGRFSAMASPCEVLIDSADTGEAESLTAIIAAEAWRIEDKFSRYVRGNIIDRINNADGALIEVDDETARLIDFAVTLIDLSDGAFDITSGVLRRVWRFDGSSQLPSRQAVKQVLKDVGWRKVHWQAPHLRLSMGMEIDLGGIGKEYAVDRCAALARDSTDVGCLVNFGGDLVATRGPVVRGSWDVGIESVSPLKSDSDRVLKLSRGALATSGDARRYLFHDGVRYSHILDPTTGWPVPDAPRSVTVAADTCTQAGMLSTLAMLKGAQAEAFLEEQGVQYWCNRGTGTMEPL
jgi:thiamine biosynthesis lipoprotein